jgi:hypothetical protein
MGTGILQSMPNSAGGNGARSSVMSASIVNLISNDLMFWRVPRVIRQGNPYTQGRMLNSNGIKTSSLNRVWLDEYMENLRSVPKDSLGSCSMLPCLMTNGNLSRVAVICLIRLIPQQYRCCSTQPVHRSSKTSDSTPVYPCSRKYSQ